MKLLKDTAIVYTEENSKKLCPKIFIKTNINLNFLRKHLLYNYIHTE